MCKIISLFLIYILYIYSITVICFNTSDTNFLKNTNKHAVGATVASLLRNKDKFKRNDEDEDDDLMDRDDDSEEGEDDEKDDVDTALDQVEEREEEEEKMLEDAEDIGVKESMEEEKSEDDFAKKKMNIENKGKQNSTTEEIKYLMDQMVQMTLELRELNERIASFY